MKDEQIFPKLNSAYESFLSTVREFGMEEKIFSGVLLGFSGGPDSMLLLHLLLQYRKDYDFPIVAVHIHHGIRGDAADRDASFAEQVCKENAIEFLFEKVDAPAFASENHIGLEEAGRILRYSVFDKIIEGRKDISTIALAHNSTDNLETVLFHLMRGSGIGGMCGISPVRDNVIRPLIALTKEEILSALHEANIRYSVDETNCDTSYTRNYIRNEILPLLHRLSPSPEVSVRRFCRNLRNDNDYLDKEAALTLNTIHDGSISSSLLKSLHPSIFARVLIRWGASLGVSLTQRQIDMLRFRLMESGHFSFDLGAGFSFCRDQDSCFFENIETHNKNAVLFKTVIFDEPVTLNNGLFLVSLTEYSDFSPNIYKFSIKQSLSSAIIEGELFLRYRKDGDAYYYGGMTHKLKKLFNDKKLSLRERASLPILCDKKGIVWVPGFGVRDDGGCDDHAPIAAYYY